MNFSAWHFFWAGLACAAVPIIIHLLNRRRYRVVNWAAMDFLRQALQRNRRIMQLRDLLLLLLRTAAVFLFGMALAQPFFESGSDEEFDRNQPLHAVMVVDNSLSMGYQEGLDRTLLGKAKDRAEEFIKQLPRGSRITVVPLCGSPGSYSLDPYRTPNDAIGALNQIDVVHRTGSFAGAANLAQKASEAEPNYAKRVVFIGDQQQGNWRGSLQPEELQQFPSMQVVDASANEPENSWISDFRLEDGIADVETPATFTVRLRHQGPLPRKDVQISLWVRDKDVFNEVVPKRVDLESGTGEQEVVFKHVFNDINVEPGKVTYVPVKVTLATDEHDRLALDNERFLVVPVVAAVPVVFVDQYGALGEKPSLNRYGETWPLRRWLAPVVSRTEESRQLVKIRHLTVDELSEESLADARLVVIAGVRDPAAKVDLLRDYVRQGGQLFIAAGGEFNPGAWTSSAWLEGQGVLPVPLKSDFRGTLPGSESTDYEWFEISYDNVMQTHALFRLGGVSDEELASLYGEAIFFQVAEAESLEQLHEELLESEKERLQEELTFLAEARQRLEQFATLESEGRLTDEQRAQRVADQERLSRLRPDWLRWVERVESETLPDEPAQRQAKLEQLARRSLPQLLARFRRLNDAQAGAGESGTPEGAYLPAVIQRNIGQGRVVLSTGGVTKEWTTLSQSNTILMFGRILRSMLRSTLPQRNFAAQDRIHLPVDADISGLVFQLQRPAAGSEPPIVEELRAGYLDAQTRGLTINDPLYQGIYTVTAYQAADSADQRIERQRRWETVLAVNLYDAGGSSESDLGALSRDEFEERMAGVDVPVSWVGPSESISLAGAAVRGQNSWLYLTLGVLALLLAEIAILAWPAVNAPPQNGGQAAAPTGNR